MTYGTEPGRCVDDGGRKAPSQYREDVAAALVAAGIQTRHAGTVVIDYRAFILESKNNKLSAQQTADKILDNIGDVYRGTGQV